jgi:class 3 adenylate cyclase
VTPRIQYATAADGVRIAYAVFGAGDDVPIVALRPALFSNVEAEWQLSPALRAVWGFDQLVRSRRVVRLDVRGGGLSDRAVADLSFDARVGDVAVVVESVGLQRFAIDAVSEASLIAFAYAAQFPERVSHLVLTDAWLRGSGSWDTPRQQAMDALRRADWQLGTDTLGLLSFGWTDAARELAAYCRTCLTREDYFALHDANWGLDLTPALPAIAAPALVCTSPTTAHLMRAELARELMSGLRDARLVSFRSPDERLRATQEFVDGTVSAPAQSPVVDHSGGAFRTIVFTDLEGHTEMMQRLGDGPGRDVLRDYERLTRDALRGHGGTEMKALGDGFMASFPSATRALQFAGSLQRAVGARAESGDEPLRVRIGVNAGEPIAEDGDLFGTAVIMAARVADEAVGGQVLVADVVRQLVAGKGFLFAERCDAWLAGFSEPVRVWEYLW